MDGGEMDGSNRWNGGAAFNRAVTDSIPLYDITLFNLRSNDWKPNIHSQILVKLHST